MEQQAVVEALAALFRLALVDRPGLGTFGEADEVGDGARGLFIKGLAGQAAHDAVDDDSWAGWDRRGLGGIRGSGSVGQIVLGGCRDWQKGERSDEGERSE